MAWHASDSQRMAAVLEQAERLRTACYADRFDATSQRTQEDHRGFADQMLERLVRLPMVHGPVSQAAVSRRVC